MLKEIDKGSVFSALRQRNNFKYIKNEHSAPDYLAILRQWIQSHSYFLIDEGSNILQLEILVKSVMVEKNSTW